MTEQQEPLMEGMEIVGDLPQHPQNDGNAVEDMSAQEAAVYVRRSVRDPNLSYLERPEVKKLLGRIHADDHDTVILKLKDHLVSDINSLVLDEVITALHSNSCCQALYFQNVSRAMKDTQIDKLIELLLVKPIWCLNLGENYQVSNEGWATFCNALPRTNVTHLYISEHVITLDLKNKIRSHIRDNRKKHDKHSNLNNLDVIERCTNMWWNPINAIRHKYAADAAKETKEREEREREERLRRQKEKEKMMKKKDDDEEQHHKRGRGARQPLDLTLLNDSHVEFWAPGVGKGGEEAWKFLCKCGERCSSYENYRYHPTGRQFQCTTCQIWSHTQCVLGKDITDEEIEELEEQLCHACRSKVRRSRMQELEEAGYSNGLPSVISSRGSARSETSEECPTDSGEGQTSASSNSGETEADGAFPMFPEGGLEGHVALDGGLEEEDEEGEEEEEDEEMQGKVSGGVSGVVQEIAKPQEEEVKVEVQAEVAEEEQGQEEGQEVVVQAVMHEVVEEVVQELVQEDQQNRAVVEEAKVLQGLDVALEGAMEIVNEVFAAPGPLFTDSSEKGGDLFVGGPVVELQAAKLEAVVVAVDVKDAVVVPGEIPQVVQLPLLANRQDIVEPEQQQHQQQQQQQQQSIVGRKRGLSSDWQDNGILDIAPSSKNPRELQRMAPLFDGARFIGRDWSGLVQSQGQGGSGSSGHSSNGITASAVDLGVDHSNASTWIAPFSFQTSNYAHSNGGMVVNPHMHTGHMRDSGISPTSSIAQFTKGVAVKIVGTDNVLQRVPHLVGCIGTVREVPVHPNTWFKIEFSDGNIVTFRPSAFKVVDSAQDFDFDDLIVPLPNGSSSSANQTYLPDDTYFPDWKEQDMTITAGIAIDGLHSNIDDANDWELGLGLGL